jgi:tetratricopeptide (TPR) repeat protein
MSGIERHLKAAIGYLELGMLVEANEEIESLSPELKTSSPVLGVRMEIYRASKKWSLMEVVARELWKRHQDEAVYWNDHAWAVRRADSIKAAQNILLDAVERFPGDAMTHYNLGCYACQLFELEQAKEWLGQAIKLDGKFKILALGDSDLEPLWKDWAI